MNSLDSGGLRNRFDIILAIDGCENEGSIPTDSAAQAYRYMFGRFSDGKSLPALKAFVESGGVVLTTGSSARLLFKLGVPVRNRLVEIVGGNERPPSPDQFFNPGSVMRAEVNTGTSETSGMDTAVYFCSGPAIVFDAVPHTGEQVKPLLWYGVGNPLASGWLIGPAWLRSGMLGFSYKMGEGRVLGFAMDLTFRAETHALYKMLFNELYSSALPAPSGNP